MIQTHHTTVWWVWEFQKVQVQIRKNLNHFWEHSLRPVQFSRVHFLFHQERRWTSSCRSWTRSLSYSSVIWNSQHGVFKKSSRHQATTHGLTECSMCLNLFLSSADHIHDHKAQSAPLSTSRSGWRKWWLTLLSKRNQYRLRLLRQGHAPLRTLRDENTHTSFSTTSTSNSTSPPPLPPTQEKDQIFGSARSEERSTSVVWWRMQHATFLLKACATCLEVEA